MQISGFSGQKEVFLRDFDRQIFYFDRLSVLAKKTDQFTKRVGLWLFLTQFGTQKVTFSSVFSFLALGGLPAVSENHVFYSKHALAFFWSDFEMKGQNLN